VVVVRSWAHYLILLAIGALSTIPPLLLAAGAQKSFTAKDARPAKEHNSLTAEVAEDATKSLDTKDTEDTEENQEQ
jgi:hypothetical protein